MSHVQSPRPHYAEAKWRPDRLRLACRIRGAETPADLRRLVNAHRGPAMLAPLESRTAERWWSGENDPSNGRTGHPVAVFELANVLQVSVDWLMGRVRREVTFSEHTRRKFAGDEGWS